MRKLVTQKKKRMGREVLFTLLVTKSNGELDKKTTFFQVKNKHFQ